MDFGKLLLRLFLGGVIAAHGLQKLRGWFGGPGLGGTEQMMKSMGMQPPRQNAVLVALTETVGGASIALGAATPAGAAGVIGAMVSAIRMVHAKNGPWSSKGGWEFNGLIIASAFAVAAAPGKFSFDALAGKKTWGAPAAIAALAAGTASSFAVSWLSKRQAVEAPAADILETED